MTKYKYKYKSALEWALLLTPHSMHVWLEGQAACMCVVGGASRWRIQAIPGPESGNLGLSLGRAADMIRDDMCSMTSGLLLFCSICGINISEPRHVCVCVCVCVCVGGGGSRVKEHHVDEVRETSEDPHCAHFLKALCSSRTFIDLSLTNSL